VPRLGAPLFALVVGALLLGGCGSGDKAASTPAPGAAKDVGCRPAAAPSPKDVGRIRKPHARLDSAKTYVATVSTNCGDFDITLDAKRAPRTGGSFAYLARKGFFDDLTFHRIDPQFVIQGGDPKGDGTGGPGYTIVEKPPADLAYRRGVVAMAKTQLERPGTSGSQFFVTVAEDLGLPPDYALLGRVTRGMEVVDRIAAMPRNGETPLDPIVISKVTVSER
jgi:peptidyl-prolyl cis-trans isomerase B (cyclophilin B)